ncbi:MogA/MoaB family molybdenum cofactor biosynthesis protein [Clostridium intestinale]|uniref:Molybdenum cofactor biosynthesis protein B n=1 Tax=Clostridium intestinale DSM 6191 TaxID=1121320 RepID=A0A1M5YGR7_9CLOT|nr:MogA/MoaB family molybdenum cofactor biosynthesis protein [Clostridium intestinale]SHI11048.1 molybdenum cofactor synthesis domain-containing protein [Clostridium intestinale DSM 6191]
MYSVGIITASDKGSKGERVDKSGDVIRKIVEANGYEVNRYVVVPDEREVLKKELTYMSDELKLNLIVTTGGTGFSKRDVTPEATKEIIEREVPGISEAIRAYSLTITKRAMLSRGVSGIRGNTLIVNLPGSPKAVRESLEYIITELEHGIKILIGEDSECAR